MKMNRIIPVIALLGMTISCAEKEMLQETTAERQSRVILASFEDKGNSDDADTKTTIDLGNGQVSWAAGDQIKLFWNGGNAESEPLEATDITDGSAAFHVDFDSETDPLYAVYPSTITATVSGYVHITVPQEQDGSFASASIVAAKYLDNKLYFQNVCGLVQFIVPDGITKVVITGDGSTPLCGEVLVGFPRGNISITSVQNGKPEITVNVSGAGTYYAAVLPGTSTSLYMAAYNGDTLVGEKLTYNEFKISRKQLRKLGSISTKTIPNKYFVKAGGTGDGSSWDNAAGLSTLKTLVKSTDANGKNIYMAGGTYSIESELSFSASATFAIYGGYPKDATGSSLSGRNTTANETILDGLSKNRIFVVTKANLTLDGLTFTNAKVASGSGSGSALIFQGTLSESVNNCIFRGNSNAGTTGAGAIRGSVGATGSLKIKYSTFDENTATANGGAIEVSNGTHVYENNTFTENSAANGGAIVVKGGTLKSKNNVFRGNTVSNAVACNGGAIQCTKDVTEELSFDGDLFDNNTAKYVSGTTYRGQGSAVNVEAAIPVYFTNCSFVNNEVDSRGTVRMASSASGAKLYMNACTFYNNTARAYGSALHTACPSVVHNSVFNYNINTSATDGASNIYYSGNTFISNTSVNMSGASSAAIYEAGGVNSIIVNSILENNGTYNSLFIKDGKTLTSYGHNIIYSGGNAVGGTGTVTVKDSENHPDANGYKLLMEWVGSPYWVLKWTAWTGGVAPEGFSLCTPSHVEAAVDAFDTAVSGINAKVWLNSIGALNTDRRGTARSTTAIWPGSYDNSASASL